MVITLRRFAPLVAAALMAFAISVAVVRASDEPLASYQLSQNEFSDLKLYMNYARESLEQTLERAKVLGGASLHAELKSGIEAALEETKKSQTGASFDVRRNVLLFTAVLNRALDLDRDFEGSDERNPAASALLLAAIQSALTYYNGDDKPRVTTTLVPAPDWIAYVRDQIPVLLRVSHLAPSPQARRKLIAKAMAWSFRDLNRSVHRRDYASVLVKLGSFIDEYDKGLRTPEEGQQMLLETRAALLGNNSAEIGGEIRFPSDNLPGSAPPVENTANSSIFPLVNTSLFGKDRPVFNCTERETFCISMQAALGVGTGIGINSDSISTYARASAMAQMITMMHGNKEFVMARGSAEAALGGAKPVYEFKADSSIGVALFGGPWAVLESNQFETFKEQYFRMGWGAAFPVRFENKTYVMLRIGGGSISMAEGSSPGDFYAKSNKLDASSIMIDLMIRSAKFFFVFSFFQDKFQQEDGEGDGYGPSYFRHEASLAVAYTLNFIFPNDQIKFDGRVISYSASGDDAFKTFTFVRMGLMYEVRF